MQLKGITFYLLCFTAASVLDEGNVVAEPELELLERSVLHAKRLKRQRVDLASISLNFFFCVTDASSRQAVVFPVKLTGPRVFSLRMRSYHWVSIKGVQNYPFDSICAFYHAHKRSRLNLFHTSLIMQSPSYLLLSFGTESCGLYYKNILTI